MLYIEEPDSHAHAFGPDSPVIIELIKRLDNLTCYLIKKLEENNLTEKVNLIFLSDHGMDSVSPPHFIDITQYLEPHTYDIAGSSPVLHILPHEGYEEAIYENLTEFSKKQGHFSVFKKDDLLTRWHFKNNPRTPPIFLLADDGYGFQDLAISAEYLSKKFNFKVSNKSKFGVHGYDNLDLKMKPYFVARGPKIKKNKMVIPFWTVDLFALFCEILEVPQLPSNGSLLRVHDVLVSRPYFVQVFPKFVLVAIMVYGVLDLMVFYRYGFFT
ncbi:ectonucleotide pyrophosphatase/phosphodiesterase family member 5-like [Agrilus planipennis]|uniref:Ectonucleotide pyrophosphatase/phosphodiesterase family member 5-like n=1 Tax=Agrilus planipennis TaxID=224129 RepID=A0A7F5RHS5_AGRPL|nr:ectonucleotide pyrophosphatase/phosphodiesterase family member 5-like [Agrilus planipennis]